MKRQAEVCLAEPQIRLDMHKAHHVLCLRGLGRHTGIFRLRQIFD